MSDGRVLTCVYCGHAYPQDTPAWGDKVLTDHIRECLKHPMRKAEADIALLRNALAGLVGCGTKAELEQMELAVRVLPAPEADKIASLNAIHALLATLPPKQVAGEVSESMPCRHCGGSGFITFNPNLNPNINHGIASARCPHCDRREAGEVKTS